MKLKDLQTDPLLAAMYAHDIWSQLVEIGSDNKKDCTLPVDPSLLYGDCALCKHFDNNNNNEESWIDCHNCSQFMRWVKCGDRDALHGGCWTWECDASERAYCTKLMARNALEAATRYIEEYKDKD
jgi:hypothetical protein